MKWKPVILIAVFAVVISACSLFSQPKTAETPTEQPPEPSTQVASTPAESIEGNTVSGSSLGEDSSSAPENVFVLPADDVQPVIVKGSFEFTNDIILRYYVEHAVSLTDLYGFVTRDKEWVIPISSQNLGFVDIDEEAMTGDFEIQLPALPRATLVDLNPDGEDEVGVQVFAAEYFPNLTGSPYAEGDDTSRGWPSYLASVETDSENGDEITGGRVMVWAPDEEQFFPSGFGSDGLLFTDDDPVMPIPQGYSAVDLDERPFEILRDAAIEMTLFEPNDAAVKDFSEQSYSEAFDNMFEMVRKEYAFNGIEGKEPDWDALYDELSPRIAEAEEEEDAQAFYLVLRDFALAFQDGHVGLNGGDIQGEIIRENIAGGYGFAVRILDDGRVMVVHVVSGSPADEAGIQPGAVITRMGGQPIDQVLDAVDPPTAPFSMPTALRNEQARYLVRAPLGTTTSVTYTNPQGSAVTAQLEAVNERESIQVTSPYRNTDPNGLPVEYIVASDEIGFIRLNSNMDDLNLIVRLFQRALDKFEENDLSILVIDMRANSGGANLGLAGFLTDEEIPLGQLHYYSERTGQFEPERPQDRVLPNEEQYRFEKMFVLVDEACASACELEAYAFSKVPGMVVVGEHPTAGTEAEVSRGQFELPEGMAMQFPTGRFVLPDGSIFLEGVGVEPTARVPVTEETVLANQDPVLIWAVQLANQ